MDPIIISATKQCFNDLTYYEVGGYFANKWKDLLRLHQRVWTEAHGPIPAGHHIHHRDGDKSNNRLENLVCLTPAEHLAQHPHDRPFTANALDAAAAWHRSEEGRRWHSELASGPKAKRQFTCIQCGRLYLAAHSRSGCCDQSCRKRKTLGLQGGPRRRS